MEKLPDDRLAEAYELERVIQAGEAAAVFRGKARATGDPVVVKVLRLAGTSAGEIHRVRFLKAVSALIKHAPAGAPPLKDAAWGPGAAVLVFVPVPGTRFTQFSGFTPSQAAHILARAAASLESLHAAGVAHLNLAPDNVLVASEERVFLTGLGWGFLRLPSSGAPFAAPELRKALDIAEPARCDVFSLAQVVAEVFGAQVRYGEEDDARVALPEAVRAQLQRWEELEACLGRCLHLDPFERPSSVRELEEALIASVLPRAQEDAGTVRLMEGEEASRPEGGEDESATVMLTPESFAESQPEPGPEGFAIPELTQPPGQEPEVTPPPSQEPEPPAPEDTPPAPPVEAPPPPKPTPSPPAAPQPAGRRWVLRVALGVAGVVVLALLGLWFFSAEQALPPPTPTPVPAAAKPTPAPAVAAPSARGAALFERGEELARAGHWEELRSLLAGVDGAGLTAEERARFESLRMRLVEQDRKQALAAMGRALKAGELASLRRALRDFEASGAGEEGLTPEERHLLAQARSIRDVLNRMAQEEKAQRWEGVLGEAQNLERMLPGTREAVAAQERAAQALEQQATLAENQGNLGQALSVLQTLQRYMPARPGLAEHIARLQETRAKREQARRVLERAARLGEEGKPEQGLGLLAELPAEPGIAAEVEKLRASLAARLSALDAGAPTVAPPAPGGKWEYGKGQVAKVEAKVSDDHGVVRVTLFFRKKGEKNYTSVPMSKTSTGTYVGEIVPAAHDNEDLEFYVLAEDHSGHQGMLGRPERPLELKRKRGLFGF